MHVASQPSQPQSKQEPGAARVGAGRRAFSSSPFLANRRALLLFFAAMVLCRTWEEVIFIGSALSLPPAGSDGQQALFFAKAAAFFACALLAGRIGTLQRKGGYALAAALLAVATSCTLASTAFPAGAAALTMAAAACGGAGMGLSYLIWFEICRRLEPTLVILCFLAARVLAAVPIVLCHSVPFPLLAAIGMAMPFLLLAAMAAGFRQLASGNDEPARAAVAAPSASTASLWKVFALIAVFGFAFALREPLLGNSLFASGSYTSLGGMIASLIVFLGIAALGSRFNLALAFRILLPLTTVAFLLLPTDVPFMKLSSDICSAASDTLIDILAILVLANLCFRNRQSPLRLFGLAFSIKFLFIFLGRYTWVLFGTFGIDAAGSTVFFSIVAAVVIALTMLLLPDKDTFEAWGLSLAENGAADGDAGESARRLAHRCHDFAKERGLTTREEDVLLLLVRGRTNGEIQEELFIAKETVKTHRRNIYTKCDVHSREELMALMGMEE